MLSGNTHSAANPAIIRLPDLQLEGTYIVMPFLDMILPATSELRGGLSQVECLGVQGLSHLLSFLEKYECIGLKYYLKIIIRNQVHVLNDMSNLFILGIAV